MKAHIESINQLFQLLLCQGWGNEIIQCNILFLVMDSILGSCREMQHFQLGGRQLCWSEQGNARLRPWWRSHSWWHLSPLDIVMCVLITSVLSGRVHDAKVHIGGNSVTASFNIIEDFADIRWGKDMPHAEEEQLHHRHGWKCFRAEFYGHHHPNCWYRHSRGWRHAGCEQLHRKQRCKEKWSVLYL